jgi:hypothetical protein
MRIPTFDDVLAAKDLLADHLQTTPAWNYPVLNDAVGATVWV